MSGTCGLSASVAGACASQAPREASAAARRMGQGDASAMMLITVTPSLCFERRKGRRLDHHLHGCRGLAQRRQDVSSFGRRDVHRGSQLLVTRWLEARAVP